MTSGTRPDRPIRVRFVCTGDSARSVMAEALPPKRGGDALDVHIAGTGSGPLALRSGTLSRT